MKRYLFFILLSVLACQPAEKDIVQSDGQKLAQLFDEIEKFSSSSEDSLYRGFHPKGAWRSALPEARAQRIDSLQKFLDEVLSIGDVNLSEQEKISKQVMIISLRDRIDQFRYKIYYIPFNAEGGFYNNMERTLQRLPFTTAQHYYDYLHWLPKYITVLKENRILMQKGMEEGIVAPKVIVRNTLELLKPWVVQDYHTSIFYKPFGTLPADLQETDRKAILEKADQLVGELVGEYQSLKTFVADEYMAAAKEAPGISLVPGGKEYYENRVMHYATLPLSPDSVHNLGLQEVARIRAAMEAIIQEVKFSGSFSDFLKFLRTDPQFYAKTPQELLNYAAWLSKRAEAQLPKLFNKLYTLPFTVEPVPDNIAPTYTGGRYVGGSWESKRTGIYWVNTYNLKSRTLYTLPALTLHEAVPGHHLQISLAAELKDIPRFRNQYYISAFGEGWGLYSEFLGEEMGMYTTPYDWFGRYTYEMWRACRLVVDTGIHYKGWTREQALAYLSENTALSIHEVTTEIDRYIGWPGQALSYKIGEIKIKALRKKTEEALGDKFNIGEFHEAILQNGSVPLTVLEMQVDVYIDNALKSKI
ncbi:MAG: DUF885 domain-containing protein [Cyclobacteriaceae bacterium]|nr:DUF885 domain-containing protein [Cyclobacteriaceae bacterium]